MVSKVNHSVEDPIDRLLLRHLRRDGRASYTELADLVGLSIPAARARVKRLETSGRIQGYHAVVDGGDAPLAFIQTTLHHLQVEADAIRDLLAVEHVRRVYRITGDADLIVEIGGDDVGATLDALQAVPAVARLQTNLVLEAVGPN